MTFPRFLPVLRLVCVCVALTAGVENESSPVFRHSELMPVRTAGVFRSVDVFALFIAPLGC